MPRETGLPPGTLMMLVLRVLARQPLHGYAIAQHIHQRSADELRVEEGSLYPALQKLLVKGWVKAVPAISETGRASRPLLSRSRWNRKFGETSAAWIASCSPCSTDCPSFCAMSTKRSSPSTSPRETGRR